MSLGAKWVVKLSRRSQMDTCSAKMGFKLLHEMNNSVFTVLVQQSHITCQCSMRMCQTWIWLLHDNTDWAYVHLDGTQFFVFSISWFRVNIHYSWKGHYLWVWFVQTFQFDLFKRVTLDGQGTKYNLKPSTMTRHEGACRKRNQRRVPPYH
jgi:uncharacterized protein (DUF779 family)